MTRTVRILAFGVSLAGLAGAAAPMRADTLDRAMRITFGRAVALADASSDNGVVKVTSADGRRTYTLALTYAVSRPASLRRGEIVTLGESVRGEAPPIRVWYPDDSKEGRHFIYPN